MALFQRKLTALDSLLSTFSDPYGTAKHFLVERDRPPYLLSILIALLLTLLGPALWYQISVSLDIRDKTLNSAVVLTTLTTAILFVISTTLLFKALRIRASFLKVFAACLYSLCPFIPIAIGVYVLSFAIDDYWAVIEYLASGLFRPEAASLQLLSIGAGLAVFSAFIVFLNCVRVLSNGSLLTCFFITAVCAAVLNGCYIAATIWVNDLYPGYSEQVGAFFASLLAPP